MICCARVGPEFGFYRVVTKLRQRFGQSKVNETTQGASPVGMKSVSRIFSSFFLTYYSHKQDVPSTVDRAEAQCSLTRESKKLVSGEIQEFHSICVRSVRRKDQL